MFDPTPSPHHHVAPYGAATATLGRAVLDVCRAVPELDGARIALDEGGYVPLARSIRQDLVAVLPIAVRAALEARRSPDQQLLVTGRTSDGHLWLRMELRRSGDVSPPAQVGRRLAAVATRGACELRIDELRDGAQRLTVLVPLTLGLSDAA